MKYDDIKTDSEGNSYTGMQIGMSHTWNYRDGIWKETKVAPDRWTINFQCKKERFQHAPVGSGVPVGTGYLWYIMGEQIVRKLDEDAYSTDLTGLKFKIAHQRPYWKKWNIEYPGQPKTREDLEIEYHKAMIALLTEQKAKKAGLVIR